MFKNWKSGTTTFIPCLHDLTQIIIPFWLGSKIRSAIESPISQARWWFSLVALWTQGGDNLDRPPWTYRFSAFWLRSKCSICSYQLNIWYGRHVLPSILNWFLQGDRVQELAPALSWVSLVLQYHQDWPTVPHSMPGIYVQFVIAETRDWNHLITQQSIHPALSFEQCRLTVEHWLW